MIISYTPKNLLKGLSIFVGFFFNISVSISYTSMQFYVKLRNQTNRYERKKKKNELTRNI